MRDFWRRAAAIVILSAVLTVGCRDKAAEPSLNRDLGDENRALLPTEMTLANPEVNKGSAAWLDLREPSFARVGEEAATPPTDAGGTPEPPYAEELRTIIRDYNALLADAEFAELPGFFSSAQADAVERLTTSLPPVAAKLGELNAALPESDRALQAVVEAMALTKLMHIEIGPIKAESDTTATARLANAPSARIKFVLEEGEWYLENPVVAGATGVMGQLDVAALDEVIAGIKSGDLSGDALTEKIETFKAAAAALTTAGTGAANETGTQPEEAAPESGSDGSIGT